MRVLLAFALAIFAASGAVAQTAGAIGAPRAAFSICPEPAGWESSGAFMRDTARCAYGGSDRAEDQMRISLIEDIYLKSWSYTIMNKLCFWLSVVLAITVLIWPALGALVGRRATVAESGSAEPAPVGWVQRAVAASSVQTSITALAALSFTFYAHYKDNQRTSEHLMRTLLYAETVDQSLIEATINAVREMDRGYSFSPVGQGENQP